MSDRFQAGRSSQGRFDDVNCMMGAVLHGWPQESVQLSAGPGVGEHCCIETDALRLDAGRWSTGMLVRGAGAPGSVCVGVVDGDPSEIRFRGRPLAPARIPLVQSDAEFEFTSPLPTSVGVLVLDIDRKAFDRHSRALWGMELASSAAYTLPLDDPAQGAALVMKLKRTLHDLLRVPGLLASPRVSALITDDILSALLSVTPLEPARVIMPHRHHLAREAASILRAEREAPVSIKTLCERLRISWRALDQGFRELYGLSPKTFIRISRLHHVRRELAMSDPAIINVTDVAVSWGFFQLGRFAVEYRRLFGEKPNDTLRRGALAR
jgi:AraC family transcriptional regulator, ethanolamine operon transcriptional activator